MPQPHDRPQFDAFASNYADLLRDPIRDRFARSRTFFFERKVGVVRTFFRHRGIDTRTITWLDVGCGQGELLRLGRTHFKSAVGCDPSEGMLRWCSDLTVRRQSSPQELPFDDHCVDFVTAVCVYHHVPAPVRSSFTAEIIRVLKPGGIFSIIEHNPFNPVSRLIVSRTPVDADADLLSAGTAAHLMTAAGAKVLETRYFLWFPQEAYSILARSKIAFLSFRSVDSMRFLRP